MSQDAPPMEDFLLHSLPNLAPADPTQLGHSHSVYDFPWDEQEHLWNFDFALTPQAYITGNEVATVPRPAMDTSSQLTTVFGHAQDYMGHSNITFCPPTAPSNSASHMGPPARPRKQKAATLHANDWEPYKDRILDLHIAQGLPLREVKQKIEKEFGFQAELRQYRTRISQWGNDKNIKWQEMAAIVRKRQRRKLVDTNKGELVFQVRGCHVAPQKIERWMKRNEVVGSALYAPLEAAGTPPDVGCHTISERGSPAMISACSPQISVFSPRGVYIGSENEQVPSPAPSLVLSITNQLGRLFAGQSPALRHRSLPNFATGPFYTTKTFENDSSFWTKARYRQDEEDRLREELFGTTTSTVTSLSESPVSLDASAKLLQLGHVLLDQGRYKSAEDVVRKLLESYEGQLIEREEVKKVDALNLLEKILLGQGLFNKSERLFRRVLERREILLGPEHHDTLISLGNLGSALSSLGLYEEAERLHQRALEGQEKVISLKDTKHFVSISELGLVLYNLGGYDEAEVILRRDLEENERVRGLEHPVTLISACYLGNLLFRLERYDEAEAMFRQDLEGSERVLGLEHPDTLVSVSNIARVLARLRRYEEAEAMFRRTVNGSSKVLGRQHPFTLIRISKLGLLLAEIGRYDEAEVMTRQALEGRDKILLD